MGLLHLRGEAKFYRKPSAPISLNSQYGFRKKFSTAAAELVKHTLTALDNYEYSISVFLDPSKAFDNINYEILFNKLEHYGIRGHALSWIKSYLSERSQVVYYNGTYSEESQYDYGVPQGSIVGPLLFLVYVNDMPNALKICKAIIFADDTTLSASSKDCKMLQRHVNTELNALYKWFCINKLSLNIGKMFFPNFL